MSDHLSLSAMSDEEDDELTEGIGLSGVMCSNTDVVLRIVRKHSTFVPDLWPGPS